MIPQEIRKDEADMYHVLAVEKTANFKDDSFDYSVRHLKYNQKSYEANRNILPTLGYGQLEILHNPTVKEPKEKKENPIQAAKKRADAIAEMDRVENVEKALEGETAKSVIEAGENRIKELQADSSDDTGNQGDEE
ncbi:MAG TPA: hypothetical protein VFM82_12190 [Flavobacteriaceae bacterium]|nr:hypothetical protein [Flavobacteriaceae bacterium]